MKSLQIILIIFIVIAIGWGLHSNLTSSSGIIEGSLSYPGFEIPADLEVCAENIQTKEEFCTKDHISAEKYAYGVGYKITVPVGEYYVFAKTQFLVKNELKDVKGYYSIFVTCGLDTRICPSHDPIEVIVKRDETVENINPWDWNI